uniref:Methyltransf_25 domain-containing protein n=1 Tax=Caenorhabditis tropicalis TaxID=1561998 RepID=A0A1I7TYP2_9PELO
MSSKKDGWKVNETREAKAAITEILSKLEIDQVIEIKDWLNKYVEETPSSQICSNYQKEQRKKMFDKGASRLDRIATYLKDKEVDVPSKAPNKLKYPTEGFDSDCNELNTCEIDSFLYDDEDIEELVQRDVLSRTYCPTCLSRETVPLNFISHSLSRLQVKFLFDKLMPSTCQHVLDIGSRLGAIVYGASIFTRGNVSTVGVEMDSEYAAISLNTIRQFGLKKIEILRDDIRHLPHVFKENQFIVMNNVFSFFLSKTEQEECWEFLHTHMRPGTVLAHHPPIEK